MDIKKQLHSALLLYLFCQPGSILNAAEQPLPAKAPGSGTIAATHIIYDGLESSAVADLRKVLAGFKAGEILLEKVPQEQRTGQDFYLERTNGRTVIRYTV